MKTVRISSPNGKSLKTTAVRSRIMTGVLSRGNKTTEIRLLTILKQHRITGWRRHYPIYGCPDFAFPKFRVALFVDGCFWHGCPQCYSAPKVNKSYWRMKHAYNSMHDREINSSLRQTGWAVVRVWEHELKYPKAAAGRIVATLKARARRAHNLVPSRQRSRL